LWTPVFIAAAISFSYAEENPSNGRSFIFVNQIGYFPSSSKIALVSSPTGFPYEVVNAESKQPVLKGMLELSEPRDAASGTNVWSAGFHIVQATGRYYIHVPGSATPIHFESMRICTIPSFINPFLHFICIAAGRLFPKVWQENGRAGPAIPPMGFFIQPPAAIPLFGMPQADGSMGVIMENTYRRAFMQRAFWQHFMNMPPADSAMVRSLFQNELMEYPICWMKYAGNWNLFAACRTTRGASIIN
jgi:hypothetical protein